MVTFLILGPEYTFLTPGVIRPGGGDRREAGSAGAAVPRQATTSQGGSWDTCRCRISSARFRYSAAFFFTPSRRAGDGSPAERA